MASILIGYRIKWRQILIGYRNKRPRILIGYRIERPRILIGYRIKQQWTNRESPMQAKPTKQHAFCEAARGLEGWPFTDLAVSRQVCLMMITLFSPLPSSRTRGFVVITNRRYRRKGEEVQMTVGIKLLYVWTREKPAVELYIPLQLPSGICCCCCYCCCCCFWWWWWWWWRWWCSSFSFFFVVVCFVYNRTSWLGVKHLVTNYPARFWLLSSASCILC